MIERLLSRLFAHEDLGHVGCEYMHRWVLARGLGRAVYLHKFIGPDWSVDVHDHPKRFVSIGLRGSYTEETPPIVGHYFLAEGAQDSCRFIVSDDGNWGQRRCCLPGLRHQPQLRAFHAPWVRTFAATHVHRIVGPSPERPCWTLVIVGRTLRDWGFYSSGRFVQWQKYIFGPLARARRSC